MNMHSPAGSVSTREYGDQLSTLSPTVAKVRERRALKAGVSTGIRGLSFRNENDRWNGLDADFARAIASIVLSDAEAVQYLPLIPSERFTTLRAGGVDIGVCNASMTLTRDLHEGVSFASIILYDGEGFLVRRSTGIAKPLQLENPVIAVQAGTTTVRNLEKLYSGAGRDFQVRRFPRIEDAAAAYEAGECNAIVFDRSGLAALRVEMAEPQQHVILNQIISQEFMAPFVSSSDDYWRKLVCWTFYALVAAEEVGLTAALASAYEALTPEQAAFVETGLPLYPGDAQASARLLRLVSDVGNYGEIFERNLGETSGLGVDRGLNRLWRDGGLLYAPPVG